MRLSNNPITCLDDIKILTKFENLEVLDLLECPITNIINYRDELFKLLPKLVVLDLTYKNGELYESESNLIFNFSFWR